MNRIEIGIDSFIAKDTSVHHQPTHDALLIEQLIERIVLSDEVGLDVFGLGEHYREQFLDSASPLILAAAAAKTKQIKLTSAVTVLSAIDPVRIFQQFATLDLLSKGRAEIVVGRGSFIDAFPLFGLNLNDYDSLFAEHLDLLLQIRAQNPISWSGSYRKPLNKQPIYPRPFQKQLPIWLGVGGSPESFIRAGTLGLPLMLAIIGGHIGMFARHVQLYRDAWAQAGHNPREARVGIHCLGYVADTTEQAQEEYYPGYKKMFSAIALERGGSPVTKEGFLMQAGNDGSFLVGSPQEVARKIVAHSESLGGISRVTFQMDNMLLSHEQLKNSITLMAKEVLPLLKTHKET